MKKLKLFLAALLSTFLLFAYSVNTKANEHKEKVLSTNINTTTFIRDASFSCILDGKKFTGSGTDENINAAFHLKGEDKGQIFFRLSDLKEPGEKLMFQVAGKKGSTTFKATPNFSCIGYITKGYINYLDNPITVTITEINAGRVSGTFSGKYTLSEGFSDSNAQKTIEVTDGKFDIPFSTSADWKKLYNAE